MTLGQWIAVQAYGQTYVLRFPILVLELFICIYVLPSAVTFLVNYRWPRAGRIINLTIRPLALLGTIAAFVLLVLSNLSWFMPLVIDWTYIAGPASVSLIGYFIGFFVAFVVGRRPFDQSVTFSAQSGIANISFALVMSVAMLPVPDDSIAYVPAFWFAVSSLIIAVVLVPSVAVGRWLVNRYWPEKFSLKSTDRRLKDEEKLEARQRSILTHSISLISGSVVCRTSGSLTSELADEELTNENNDTVSVTEDKEGSNVSFETATW